MKARLRNKVPAQAARKVPKKETAKSVSRRKGRNESQKDAEYRVRKTAARRRHMGLCLRLGLWAGAGILVLSLTAIGVAWSQKQVRAMDWASVKSIEIKGLRHLDRGEVLARTPLELGASWLWLGATQAEKALMATPGIRSVEVRRAFPSRVMVEIDEEEPIALAHSGYWLALFADGKMAEGHPWQGKDLPVLENVQAMQAQRRVALCDFLGRVKRERPESFARFSQVTPLSGQDIAVILRDGQARLLLDVAAKSLNSLDFLESLLRDHASTWRTGANIDLRVDDHAYVL